MLLAFFIFLAEMFVVTLGTVRIIFVSRGHKVLAPLLGFFEILIWLFAIGQIMKNLNDWSCFLAFALGFTLGNFLGILLEKKLAMGMVNVHIITHRDPLPLVRSLRGESFGVTLVEGHGSTGPVHIIMTIIKRKQLARVTDIIHRFDPRTFYAVDDLQIASAGIFPLSQIEPSNPVRFSLQVLTRTETEQTTPLAG